MAAYSVDVSDLERIAREYPQARAVIDGELEAAMSRSVLSVEAKAKEYAPWATGDLRRSITHQVRPIAQGVEGIVGTNKAYARYVEEGRRPGSFPPVEPLMRWVVTKTRYSNVFGIDIRDERQVRSMAYLVARKIARFGIEPRPYLGKAVDELWPAVEREFRAVPRRVVAKVAGGGR